MYPIQLKLGMLDHMNSTFRNTFFGLSVDVPLKNPTERNAYWETSLEIVKKNKQPPGGVLENFAKFIE